MDTKKSNCNKPNQDKNLLGFQNKQNIKTDKII